jgi:hypothetical protein
MKHTILSVLILLLASNLFSCEKSNTEPPSDLFDGKKLEGKWLLVKSTVSLRFDDGSVQNATIDGDANDYLEFKYLKTTAHKAEGTFLSSGLGFQSSGRWTLAQDKAELDFIYNETPALYQYRRIDELDQNTLVMSADDKMVLLIYESNDVQPGAPNKKLVGGSVFEQYKR